MGISDLLAWFAGGSRRYMTLYHCMNHDLPWVILTVALDLAVAAGYALIALHWWREQRNSSKTVAQQALKNMKNIFVFCGICGYLFIPIKMVWPAWRLYDLFLAVLAVYTWRYAWNARELKVIYHELTRTERLVQQLDEERAESRRKSLFLNALSHDLRTPLNGLVLQAKLAEMELDDLPLPPEQTAGQREALGVIRSNAKAVAALLDRLLEFGRAEGGEESLHPVAFDLDDLLHGVAGRFRAVAGGEGLDAGGVLASGPVRLHRRDGRGADRRQPRGQRPEVHAHWRRAGGRGADGRLGGDPRQRHGAGHRRGASGPAVRRVLPGGQR